MENLSCKKFDIIKVGRLFVISLKCVSFTGTVREFREGEQWEEPVQVDADADRALRVDILLFVQPRTFVLFPKRSKSDFCAGDVCSVGSARRLVFCQVRAVLVVDAIFVSPAHISGLLKGSHRAIPLYSQSLDSV